MKIPSKRSFLLLLIALVLTIAVGGFWLLHRSGHQSQERVEAAPSPESTGLRIAQSERPQRLPSIVVRNQSGQHQAPPSKPPLAEAISPGSGLTFEQRLAVIHHVSHSLSREEVRALLSFVEQSSLLPGLSAREQGALENDILNLLHRQPDHAESIRQTLISWTTDDSLPALKRDYALQHLASIEEDVASTRGETHWEVIENGAPELAATAMLHLLAEEREAGGLSQADRERLARAARLLVEQTAEDPASRATALQVCGRLKVQAIRQDAFTIASDREETFPLRIAAIATLSELQPTEEIVRFLETLKTGREKRLRLPASAALNRLKASHTL